MKKQVLVSLFALAAFASTAQAMQEPLLVKQSFAGFSVPARDLSWNTLDGKFKELDNSLKLEKPVRTNPLYSVYDIVVGALGRKKLTTTAIGDNAYGPSLLKILRKTYVDDEGKLDAYDAVHTMREDQTYLSPILTGLQGMKKEEIYKSIDEASGLVKPAKNNDEVYLWDFVQEKCENKLCMEDIGNNNYSTLFNVILCSIRLNPSTGKINYYDAAHAFIDNSLSIEALLPKKQEQSTLKPKEDAPTSRFTWIKPTITYTGLFFGGMAVLKAYQLYKNK